MIGLRAKKIGNRILMKRMLAVLMILPSFFITVPSALSAAKQDDAVVQNVVQNVVQTVVHTVVFWFKPGTAEAVVATAIEEVKKFKSLPMVRDVYVGKAIMSDRDVVDDSFSVMLTLVFDSEEKLREYESDPYHQRVSKTIILPHVTRAVIYDHLDK